MGKRGPQPGTKYRKRSVVRVRPIQIQNDRQLVAAQHFNDDLEDVMTRIDLNIYPAYGPFGLPSPLLSRLRASVEAAQQSVIDGILGYSEESARGEGDGTDSEDEDGVRAPDES